MNTPVRFLYRLRFLFMLLACPVSIASAQSKPVFVLVHGAWGGSWAFKNADSILTSQGFSVYRPSLTGQGERVHLSSPDIDLNTHILDVVNTILFEDLRDIVLVGHSYGGMVITGVADSIPERIRRLVYLDAFVPDNGQSLTTSRGPNGQLGPERSSKNGFVIPGWIKEDAPIPRDVPQSLKTFTTPVSWKNPKAKALPATYILTVDPGKKPEEDAFFIFSERAKARGWKTLEMTADHNPQWSRLKELTGLLAGEK